MLGRFLWGKLGRAKFPSTVTSFTSGILAVCIHVRISVGVPIGMVGVAAESSSSATRYCRRTCYSLSSLSGGGGTVGCEVLMLVDDSLDIMLPRYRNPDRSLSSLLRHLYLTCV